MSVGRRKHAAKKTPEEIFGLLVRQFREARGLSQEELGFEGQLHRTYVSLLERGRRSPSLRTILALAAALGVPPSRLLREVESRLSLTQTAGHGLSRGSDEDHTR